MELDKWVINYLELDKWVINYLELYRWIINHKLLGAGWIIHRLIWTFIFCCALKNQNRVHPLSHCDPRFSLYWCQMSSSRNCYSLAVVIQDQWVLLLPWNLATVPACINLMKNVWEKFLLPLFHMTFPQYLEDRSSTVIQLALQKTSNRTNVRWSWLWIIYLLKAACVPFHLLRLITKQYKRSESFEWCETLEEIIIIYLI